MVFGTFDVLHPGHEFVLNEALRRGDVTVIVARDENVKKIKGRLPVENESVRKSAIEKKFPRAHTVLGDPENFLVPVQETKPDLILLGYDQRLPPGIDESSLPATERLTSFEPGKYKSSLRKV